MGSSGEPPPLLHMTTLTTEVANAYALRRMSLRLPDATQVDDILRLFSVNSSVGSLSTAGDRSVSRRVD